jgi:hypothetical protein
MKPIVIPESSKKAIFKIMTQCHNNTPPVLGLAQIEEPKLFTGQVIPVETILYGGYMY